MFPWFMIFLLLFRFQFLSSFAPLSLSSPFTMRIVSEVNPYVGRMGNQGFVVRIKIYKDGKVLSLSLLSLKRNNKVSIDVWNGIYFASFSISHLVYSCLLFFIYQCTLVPCCSSLFTSCYTILSHFLYNGKISLLHFCSIYISYFNSKKKPFFPVNKNSGSYTFDDCTTFWKKKLIWMA